MIIQIFLHFYVIEMYSILYFYTKILFVYETHMII